MKWRIKLKLESKKIYFDNAASTYMYDEVIEYVNHINKNYYANTSSTHFAGFASHETVKTDNEKLCGILHIRPSTLVYTSGGAESNNFAIKGIAFANLSRPCNIVISAYEHPSVFNSAKYLEKFGFEIRVCPLNTDGTLDLNKLSDMVDDKTILVSTAHVCSEIGALSDIPKISSLIKTINPRCCYHVDAVQSFGKIKINLSEWSNVDMMSFSSHKIHGPKGIGALYIKHHLNIDPLISGSLNAGLRAGTINTSGVCGFSKAAEIICKDMAINYDRISSLKQYMIDSISSTGLETRLNTPIQSSPYILNISFKNIKSEVLLNALSERGICVSSGSACASKAKISYVLKTMNLPKEYNEGAIRFSFSDHNTTDEIDYLINNLKELIPALKAFVRR